MIMAKRKTGKTKPCFKTPSQSVSERMRMVKSKGTKLELRMEELLREAGIRYRRHPDFLGKPDFEILRTNVLIFCDSSFWHGRREKEISGEAFKKNKAFWMNKLEYNKNRDARINRTLRKQCWSVWRFWDTDVMKRPEYVKKRLLEAISKNGKRKAYRH